MFDHGFTVTVSLRHLGRSGRSDDAAEETADAWIAAWEAKAAGDGLERGSTHRDASWDWIAAQRQDRVRPD